MDHDQVFRLLPRTHTGHHDIYNITTAPNNLGGGSGKYRFSPLYGWENRLSMCLDNLLESQGSPDQNPGAFASE